MQPQVLIAGSGPTGLALAIVLLKSGVPVRIINKEPDHHIASRGAGIQARIAELHYILGTLSDVKALGTVHPPVKYYDPADPHKVLKSMPMSEAAPETPAFPITKSLFVGQYLHERVLRSHVEALGGTVELGTELSGLEQTEDRVTVKLVKTAEGERVEEHATFSFVVGADGARSAVRNALGLDFIGETHDTDRMLVADVNIKGINDLGMHTFGSYDSVVTSIRTTAEPDRYNLFIAGAKYPEIAAECLEADLKKLQAILVRITGRDDLELFDIYVKGDWRLNIRMVDHFQKGRVFVAGDAAHVHPSTGGQGLTSGFQDAFNLAWKLALVIQGAAPPSLLTSYEAERHPIIADMLERSSGLFNNMRSGWGGAEHGNHPLYRERNLSQLTLNFRWSPVVLDDRFPEGTGSVIDAYGVTGGGLRAGDRAPDAPGLAVLAKRAAPVKVDRVEAVVQEGAIRMFDTFDVTVHTVLVFSPDAAFVCDVSEAVRSLPAQFVRTIALVPTGAPAQALIEDPIVDLVLEDKEEYAFAGYEFDRATSMVVIVRPDAMIGAFVKGPAGITRYFAKIFADGL